MSNPTSGARRRGRSAVAPLTDAVQRLVFAIEAVQKAMTAGSQTAMAPHLDNATRYVSAAKQDVARVLAVVDPD